MSHITLAHDITLNYADGPYSGELIFNPDDGLILIHHNTGEPEFYSADLLDYGYTPIDLTETFVTEGPGYTGLANALVEAGVAEIIDHFTIGPFNTPAYRLDITIPD